MPNRTNTLGKCLTFASPVGVCAIGFSETGITSFTIGAEGRLSEGTHDCPPWIHEALNRIQRHLKGEPQTFADLPFDFGKTSPFFEAVYRALLQIPSGGTISYKELAERAGRPLAVRAVGNAMARNPIPLLIPCHRVLAAGGRSGGYTGGGGLATKVRLLALEGVTLQH